jgi:thiamine-phosphate pyrophosphorylase
MPVVSKSCHSIEEVQRACADKIDLILFGPVFEKRVDGELAAEGVGLELLRKACEAAGDVPVLALGGVTAGNANLCLEEGAQGIASIRLFQSQALDPAP